MGVPLQWIQYYSTPPGVWSTGPGGGPQGGEVCGRGDVLLRRLIKLPFVAEGRFKGGGGGERGRASVARLSRQMARFV